MSWGDFLAPLWLSAKIAGTASLFVFILGTGAACWMRQLRFTGKTVVETLFMLPLVLPPTVIGFVLLVVFGRKSAIGRVTEWLWQQPIVFTWGAGVLAAVVVAFPLVYQTAKTGFASVDPSLEEAARSMGASESQVLRWVTLPLSSRFLMTGYILGFARALGEFGATIMIAGNIPRHTQTVPTAIYSAVDAGEYGYAWSWTAAVLLFSFALLWIANRQGRVD
ncbi:molybdate ABC transporter permease subunit [Paenibacillus lutrae]|uniref:Molybdenum transport system permease n=1 Tax=Paenibacillus lutrae TaxID=2078573 RepID=A0A7X3FIM8_9BACL|nr:molybdate ABC transporter permease subunit [Paenibacillus lutrae]MVP00252.1 molybdate ABC transporter permease subunit [Paenibacillus lutrae]